MKSNEKMKTIVVEGSSQDAGVDEDTVNPSSLCQLQGQRVDRSLVGNLLIHGRLIQTPGFIFEIANREDFLVAILNDRLVGGPHIVSVPAFKWDAYTHSIPVAIDDDLNRVSVEFVKNNHIVAYEPPELYRYSMPKRLVIHALRDDIPRIRRFYRLGYDEDRKEDALSTLPPFEREFVRRQWDSLMWKHYLEKKRQQEKSKDETTPSLRIPKQPDSDPDAEAGWTNTWNLYKNHIAVGMKKTIEMNISSSFVPVVRTLKSSSEKYVRSQVEAQNKFAERYWRLKLKGYYLARGRPWFHLSLDKSIFVRNGEIETTPQDAVSIVNSALDPTSHCGICLTVTGWEKAWTEGKPRTRLEEFVSEICDIASAANLPVYGARSKWIGIYLLDSGLSFAGTIMNGNDRIAECGGSAGPDDPNSFGNTPIYGECLEKKINELFEVSLEGGQLERPIELHHLDGVESKCDPMFQDDPKLFRMEFSKPRRIATHSTEVREIRNSLEKGIPRPGKEYIKRSEFWEKGKAKPKNGTKPLVETCEIEK